MRRFVFVCVSLYGYQNDTDSDNAIMKESHLNEIRISTLSFSKH